MLFENPAPLNMRLRVQPRSFTVEKMAGIFTKRIWLSYILITLWKCRSWTESIQVEYQKEGKGRKDKNWWKLCRSPGQIYCCSGWYWLSLQGRVQPQARKFLIVVMSV